MLIALHRKAMNVLRILNILFSISLESMDNKLLRNLENADYLAKVGSLIVILLRISKINELLPLKS